MIYLVAIPLAFVTSWVAGGLYVLVTIIWLVPDRRIETTLVRGSSAGYEKHTKIEQGGND